MAVTLHSSEHDEGVVEIVVYNRASLLFTTDTEACGGFTRCAATSVTITMGGREA